MDEGERALADDLRAVYAAKEKQAEFAEEANVYAELLPALHRELAGRGYQIIKPLAPGSTATVWLIKDTRLEQDRALKLARPRLGKLAKIVSIVRAEPKRLASLNHQNIVKVYAAGSIELSIANEAYSLPYFIMDFLSDVEDLDVYILSHRKELKSVDVIQYFRDILLGLLYLHENEIFHCDLKPANVLLAPRAPALIADLGYAKHVPRMRRDESSTDVTFTREYAHPDLVDRIISSSEGAANIAQIRRDQLSVAFDLFALGRSIQEVLAGCGKTSISHARSIY